jgi:AcrR family transcriptional regulator
MKKKKTLSPSDRSLLIRRVVKDHDKQQKKALFLKVSAELLNSIDFADFSMDLVAKKSSTAKGTLYLYFKTKEELFLEIMKNDYMEWFQSLQDHLNEYRRQPSGKEVCSWMTNSLRTRPRFIKMLPLEAHILAQSQNDELIFNYKKEIFTGLKQTAAALQKVWKSLSFKECVLLLVQAHIVVVGSWPHGFPSKGVKDVMRREGLGDIDFDYFDLVNRTLNLILKDVV